MSPWNVPRLWPEATVAILASGPSLTPDQAIHAGRKADHVIAINESWRLWQSADLLYGADAAWWIYHQGVPQFQGLKVACQEQAAARYADIFWLRYERKPGLSFDPSCIHAGGSNSGFQALNVAVLAGARRLILLGFDLRLAAGGRTHWHGHHPRPLNNPAPVLFQRWIKAFEAAVPDLERAGVDVVNCTPNSSLKCFPYNHLEDVL